MAQRRRVRGNIERLPSGHYRAIVYAGTDPLTGRERRLKRTAETQAEAKVALTELQRQVDQQQHPKSAISVREALEQWMEVADLEVTTRERYEDLIRLYIVPRLGHLQAGKLDAEILERFYARLQMCRELCSGKPPKGHTCRPLSSSTTRKIHYILRGALDRAVRWRYLSVNPAELVAAPTPRPTKPDPPSADEAAVLISNAWRDPGWGLLLWLTMVTGFWRGELCSLRWRHLDRERGNLWVERSTAQTSRAGVFEKDTKTDSDRRLALDPETVQLLLEHRARVETQCPRARARFTAEAFVFSLAPDHSSPLLPQYVSRRYRRLALKLGLRSTRLHALRHYSATELLTRRFAPRELPLQWGRPRRRHRLRRLRSGTPCVRLGGTGVGACGPRGHRRPARRPPQRLSQHAARREHRRVVGAAARPPAVLDPEPSRPACRRPRRRQGQALRVAYVQP